jgi:hypothetical protein
MITSQNHPTIGASILKHGYNKQQAHHAMIGRISVDVAKDGNLVDV